MCTCTCVYIDLLLYVDELVFKIRRWGRTRCRSDTEEKEETQTVYRCKTVLNPLAVKCANQINHVHSMLFY